MTCDSDSRRDGRDRETGLGAQHGKAAAQAASPSLSSKTSRSIDSVIERLRKRADWGLSCSDGSTCYQWDGGALDTEAADTITRLSDAMRDVLFDDPADISPVTWANFVAEARALLATKEQPHD